MRRLFKKFQSRRGEVLAEALVSILVIALTAAILATAVTASARVDIMANTANDEIYEKLNAAAEGDIDHSDWISVSVTGTGVGDGVRSFYVDYSGDGELTAYYLTGGGG